MWLFNPYVLGVPNVGTKSKSQYSHCRLRGSHVGKLATKPLLSLGSLIWGGKDTFLNFKVITFLLNLSTGENFSSLLSFCRIKILYSVFYEAKNSVKPKPKLSKPFFLLSFGTQ